MKINLFLIFIFALISTKGNSQETKISLHFKNATFQQILAEIEKQSDYRFVYKDQDINQLERTSIHLSEKSIEHVLDVLFSNQALNYQLLDDNLIVLSSIYLKRMINGCVTNKIDGQPIPYVNVSVKGKSMGTVTDLIGNYSISVPNDTLTLIFSFIGYLTEEVAVKNQTQINVELLTDVLGIEEVVFLGYGSGRKRTVIGSQVTINESQIKSFSSQSFVNSLQGIATGLNVSTISGTPGAPVDVKIRGVNSINAGTDPLWIIDGMPIFVGTLGRTNITVPQDIMSTMNPHDIKSIEILKDAAATAIYGSRGSNGVIIISTKSGMDGNGSDAINFNYSTGISDLTRSPELFGFANSQEWWTIMDRAAAANGRQGWDISHTMKDVGFEKIIEKEDALRHNTNWFDILLQKGIYTDANLSYSQRVGKGSVYTSISYHKNQSVNIGNELTRFSGRINVELKPLKNLSFITRVNLMNTNNFRTKTKGGNAGTGFGFGAANMNALPWFPVYDSTNSTGYWNPKASPAVTTNRNLIRDNIITYRALGGLYAEYKLPWLSGISIRAEASTDIIQDNSNEWMSEDVVTSGRTTVYERAVNKTAFNNNTYITYSKTFKENHWVNATAGTESYRRSYYLRDMEALDPITYNQELGNTTPTIMSSMRGYMDGERYIRSYFGRGQYILKDKYIIGFSYRRDGSSAFAKEGRWGNFAAISAGWIISDEIFFERFGNRNNFLKLRGSFGQTGNESIPNNQHLTNIFNSSSLRYVSQVILPVGTGVSVGNSLISWEITDSYDIGIDYGILNNRLSGSIASYLQQVSNMLLKVSTPLSAAVGSIYDNVGDMNNWGWEINMNSINIQKKNFQWSSSLNVTTNHNKIIKLTPEMERQKGSKFFVGGPLGVHQMARYAGIDPERGVRMIWEIDRDIFNETGEYVETGRKIPATYNNLDQHKQILKEKTNLPKYFGGISNSFTYLNFDLDIQLTFTGGNYIYNSRRHQWANPTNGQNILLRDLLTDSWTTPGQTDAKYPVLYTEGQAPASTKWSYSAIDPKTGFAGYWQYPDLQDAENANDTETYEMQSMRFISNFLEKGDYLRLRSITLGYNLNEQLSNRIGVDKMRVYVNGTNLWTWTAFSGFDPETVSYWDYLPALRAYNIGISTSF